MRKVFIADAHLRRPEDRNYRSLMQFLTGLKGNTDTLYILGDLFEFWLGYREIRCVHYLPVLELLRELKESGVAIVYFEGNHDFHMGPYFHETLGAQVHDGPRVLSIQGKRVYICHGDQVMTADYGYRVLRFALHNRLAGVVLPLIPYRVTFGMAELMARRSRGNHGERNRRLDYRKILQGFASARFDEGCDMVISAHFHTPFLSRTGDPGDGKVLVSIGEWMRKFSYGEWDDGGFSLRTFTPDGAPP